ncbi:MAG TPA: NAD(P)H-hydrate dehydratase [Desulfobacterales bacterium]|nr:NAD(P)H-hydrate dehydratase [Desulfobacterales bacterium]
MKLAAAEVMRRLDAAAINDYGIPGIVLMENAGRSTVDIIQAHYGPLNGKKITVVTGPGNNGGDGLVIARYLHQLGAVPRVFMLVPAAKMTGDAALNLSIVRKLPIELRQVADDLSELKAALRESKLVVDAIFGTGLRREVGGRFAAVIGLLNNSRLPVTAVDIPSGLNSDNGQVMGAGIKAALTVTYGLAKPGQIIYPGADLIGRLEVVDIGIPPEVVEGAGINLELLRQPEVSALLHERPANSHKGSFGHLLVLAGSHGKTGAAILCAQGALRAGTGLVTMGSPRALNTIYETRLAEAMTFPLSGDNFLTMDDYPAILQALSGKKAVVLGPGLGQDTTTRDLVVKLYNELEIPMLIDADGLNCLKDDLRPRAGGPWRVLTPHPGEMARLTGMSSRDIQTRRLETALSFARRQGVILVLKGAATIIAHPQGMAAINSSGNPGMAAGGMGDVLSGIIGGLLAQGLSAWDAARLGVYIHGWAADRLAGQATAGFLASEVANEVPLAFKELRNRSAEATNYP